jgi:hypothetical protein
MAPRNRRFPTFDSCLDENKLIELIVLLPRTYEELDKYAPWLNGRWPTRVHCMTNARIIEGRKRGAGHGYTYNNGPQSNSIWLNPHMTAEGYWLVFVHENLHHAFPDATELEINNVHVPNIYRQVFRRPMNKAWAKRHGLGPPMCGIGDRGCVQG